MYPKAGLRIPKHRIEPPANAVGGFVQMLLAVRCRNKAHFVARWTEVNAFVKQKGMQFSEMLHAVRINLFCCADVVACKCQPEDGANTENSEGIIPASGVVFDTFCKT